MAGAASCAPGGIPVLTETLRALPGAIGFVQARKLAAKDRYVLPDDDDWS